MLSLCLVVLGLSSSRSKLPDFLAFQFDGKISAFRQGRKIGETRSSTVRGISPVTIWRGDYFVTRNPATGSTSGQPSRIFDSEFSLLEAGMDEWWVFGKYLLDLRDNSGIELSTAGRSWRIKDVKQVVLIGEKTIVITTSSLIKIDSSGKRKETRTPEDHTWFVGKSGSIWSFKHSTNRRSKFSEDTTVFKWSQNLNSSRALKIKGQVCPAWASDDYLVGLKIIHGHMGEPLVLFDLKAHRERVLEEGDSSAMSLEFPSFKVNGYGD